ncbi:hypothetical protein MRX96_039097 [Rhipicephalus microplus]
MDASCFSAELVFGTTLRLPGQFFGVPPAQGPPRPESPPGPPPAVMGGAQENRDRHVQHLRLDHLQLSWRDKEHWAFHHHRDHHVLHLHLAHL